MIEQSRATEAADGRLQPTISYDDDPQVIEEQHHDDYSNHVVPASMRVGKWKLTMSFWSLTSAMVWLFYGALSTSLYGTRDALIAIVLSIITYGLINAVLSKWAVRTGLNSVLLSRQAFGVLGAGLTALLLAAQSTYFAVFESSVVAVAIHQFTPGMDIRIWYAVIALAMLPLMLGGVQTWMAKLNGFLLPFYVVGLVVVLVIVGLNYSAEGLVSMPGILPPEARPYPGWVLAYVLYMGVWLAMANTPDFARFGKVEDQNFHAQMSFGWVFYTLLFLVNGLAGAFIVHAVTPGAEAAEAGVVVAIISAAGVFGLLFIMVSQVRINTLNYYEASMNANRLIRTLTGIRVPRLLLVGIITVIVFVVMLTNVFSYIDRMLSWQASFMVGWVGILLAHYFLTGRGRHTEFRALRLPAVTWGLAVWVVSAGTGIALREVPGVPPSLSTIAPLVSLAISVVLYALVLAATKQIGATKDVPHPETLWSSHGVEDPWRTYIQCGTCERSYVAVELDRNDRQQGEPICDGCAVGQRARTFK